MATLTLAYYLVFVRYTIACVMHINAVFMLFCRGWFLGYPGHCHLCSSQNAVNN